MATRVGVVRDVAHNFYFRLLLSSGASLDWIDYLWGKKSADDQTVETITRVIFFATFHSLTCNLGCNLHTHTFSCKSERQQRNKL